jgi:ABC-type polysaccharide/polyol phosphate transport system ATPase subunit
LIEAPETLRPGAITAQGVGRRFKLRSDEARSLKQVLLRKHVRGTREIWALRDVSFEVHPGETFGVVGQNGSGKSTLLKLLAGIFAPSKGQLAVGGTVGSLLEVGAGFHMEFSGVENVYLNAAVHGLGRRYVDEHMDDILAFAEIGDYAHMPVKTYSSGMFLRLGFSVAIHVKPDILLVDEALAVGDEAFQQKCFAWIEGFQRAGGTIVFVSHDAAAVSRLCTRAILLVAGQIVADGSAQEVLRAYRQQLQADSGPVRLGGEREKDGAHANLATRVSGS